MAIPKIDPNVRHISLGQLRKEKAFTDTLVVNDGEQLLAVCVPYETFLEMQRTIEIAQLSPPNLSLPQGGPAVSGGSSTRHNFDPSLGSRVPGPTQPSPDSPLRGV